MDIDSAETQAFTAFFIRASVNFVIATIISIYSFTRSKKAFSIAALYTITFGLVLIVWPVCKYLLAFLPTFIDEFHIK